ncbi:thioredoxin domain-containing protein [Microbacterium esteraromaticum]|uniref:Thioredoxin domain-containing protein n=1 Tax=Microbacterium esteraromaticum TaxID=57043 RepID=A0A7D8AHP8_9MICO|nr:thioredoxin domain-containing protein [Microbacterium esteraromaticum]QMU96265.1 thioredoxin domain-containing protein [Microbacterium esteraromaticum]
MKNSVKAVIITGGLIMVLLIGLLVYAVAQRAESENDPKPQVLREESHVLDDAGPDAVTVVEFLDFECEACGAYYPVVEDLRQKYAGQITYAVRYFPLPGHVNSMNAALAAEAAAQQGEFEAMYQHLFETQAEWGGAAEPNAETFRALAEEVGLDMDAYDAAVDDPATAERVRRDKSEGTFLGVEGTPTFFVDGRKVTITRWGDLEKAIIEAQSR